MKEQSTSKHDTFKSAMGAALAALCGLLLWKMPLGEAWVNASYDYLFRFGSHGVTNKVVLILMDNEAFDQFKQVRGQPWDRALHTQLLDRLAADGCALVVFDSFFRRPHKDATDNALADAMRRQRHIVLMAEQARVTHPKLIGARPTLPAELFLGAAGNCGVAWLDPDLDSIVRRHWPYPAPGSYLSLPWVAAQVAGAKLNPVPQEQWLRYYGRDGDWTRLSYRFALAQPKNYYRDKIVFIGTQPKTSVPDKEDDEFSTPYTRWTGETCGGVEIMLTSFLNLMNGEWLRRSAWWLEALALALTGAVSGWTLCRMRRPTACIVALVSGIVVALGAVSWSYFTNYWIPWLVIAGGQLPCALAWALATSTVRRREIVMVPQPSDAVAKVPIASGQAGQLPDISDYELINPPFGQGSYGKVWLARNAIGQWQALKVIYLEKFGHDADPYEREFNGIKRYKPVSDKHPGLLRIDFVSRKRADFFYYVMELGDAIEPGWEKDPSTYRPRDLLGERNRAPGGRLPVRECLRIGLVLCDALEFLHQQGLTHRDIKPQNIIFVNGEPKLADVGLTAEFHPDRESTFVGTPSYMPPYPERPGTPQADIYALGMVLYVISTGRNAPRFPELSTTLVGSKDPADFFPLNSVILKACSPDLLVRYASSKEMHAALQEALKTISK